MTFLMHAARGYPGGTGGKHLKEQAKKDEGEKLRRAGSGAVAATASTEASQNNPGDEGGPQQGNTPASESLGKEPKEDAMEDLTSEKHSCAQENELVVFKVAWSLVNETLWKGQVCIEFKKKTK